MPIKTSINFGLVYIPVVLHLAVKNNDISFNMIDKKTGGRIQYKKFSAVSGKEISQSDIVKGYPYSDDRYILFEDKDFEAVKTPKDKSVAIEKFVPLEDIDPIYYDKAYYVSPEKGADRAFALLKEAMKREETVGIAKSVLGSKESLIALRVKGDTLVLSTMFFEEEIQQAPAVKENTPAEKELKLALSIIQSMSGDFNPEEYRDEYRERLQQAIDAKINGSEITVQKQEGERRITDLMEALQKSLDSTGKPKKTSAKKTPAKKEPKQKKHA